MEIRMNINLYKFICYVYAIDNTKIYSLILVLQITRFLLEDAIILSKTNLCSSSTKEKRSNG